MLVSCGGIKKNKRLGNLNLRRSEWDGIGGKGREEPYGVSPPSLLCCPRKLKLTNLRHSSAGCHRKPCLASGVRPVRWCLGVRVVRKHFALTWGFCGVKTHSIPNGWSVGCCAMRSNVSQWTVQEGIEGAAFVGHLLVTAQCGHRGDLQHSQLDCVRCRFVLQLLRVCLDGHLKPLVKAARHSFVLSVPVSRTMWAGLWIEVRRS